MPSNPPFTHDFFVSYTGKDKEWAAWIAWHLEAAGYKTIIQEWDFKSGGVFPSDMHDALLKCARVLAVLSPEYLQSDFCKAEWLAAFADDPTGKAGRLTLVRVVRCENLGLLAGRTYIDLVGKAEPEAIAHLLERLKEGRVKPATAPRHPGTAAASTAPAPAFPGLPPNNLPLLNPFFGREKELQSIAHAITTDPNTWGTLIDGSGGRGKTSLAVRAAELVSPGRFARIVFVSVKHRQMDDTGERSLAGFALNGWMEMLNEIARLIEKSDIAKEDEASRPRKLCEALRDSRTLLILDNLESLKEGEQQSLFTFLDYLPRDCRAILTSRVFTGNRVKSLPLENLDRDSALKCLAEIALHNPLLAATTESERTQLFTATGGNALLLRWTAGQLGSGSCRTLADALAFLRSCPDSNNVLRFVFGDLVKVLAEEDVRLLATLVYPSQPIPISAIVEISGVAAGRAADGLKALANRSLVTTDTAAQDFALVPMVGDFLRKERHKVVVAMGESLASRAHALIVENGYSKNAPFKVLDTAWPTVAPAIPLFVAGDNASLQMVCDALVDFLDFTGRWDEWLALEKQGESKANAAGDYYSAGWRAQRVGWVYYLRRQADEVLAWAAKAEAHFKTDKAGAQDWAAAVGLRGHGHGLKGEYSAALVSFREALNWFRTLSAESDAVACGLNDLADIERRSGDFTPAERDYREALRVAIAVQDAEGVAIYTGNLATLELDRKDWGAAEEWAWKALALSEKVGRRELIAEDCRRLALSLARQGKKSEGLPYARRAVELSDPLGSPYMDDASEALKECEEGDSKS